MTIRFMRTFLLVALAFALTACGGSFSTGPSAADQAMAESQLLLWLQAHVNENADVLRATTASTIYTEAKMGTNPPEGKEQTRDEYIAGVQSLWDNPAIVALNAYQITNRVVTTIGSDVQVTGNFVYEVVQQEASKNYKITMTGTAVARLRREGGTWKVYYLSTNVTSQSTVPV